MMISVMQPYLFPYIGYYQMINHVDTFVVLDDVQYIRRGWINRNNISISDKTRDKMMFSVPVKKAPRETLIKDILLSEEYGLWKKKFYKTLEKRYSKKENYDKVITLVKTIFDKNHQTISQLSTDSLKSVSDYLNIKTSFVFSSELRTSGTSEQKIINICKSLGATDYVNSIGGKELYSKDKFSNHKINLSFIKAKNTFNYNSIIDLLMNGENFSLKDHVLE